MSQSSNKPARAVRSRGAIETLLGLFAEVRPGEAKTVLMLTLNVFLLLTAYYLLKVAREPLILNGGGAEVKSYAAAGQSVLLVPVTLLYSALARRADRMKLIAVVSSFFIANLLLFALLARTALPLGVPFYLWVGIFNVTVIAQFWAFAADVYSEERGKRLFPILGIGSSLGAVFGAGIAKGLMDLGPSGLMLASAATLGLCLLLTWVVHRWELSTQAERKPQGVELQSAQTSGFGRKNGFALLLQDRYLLLVGALALVLNWVNSTGEYVLDRTLLGVADEQAMRTGLTAMQFVGRFKAEYFAWVNACGLLLQLFAVSRVIKYLGVRRALFILPLVSFTGYSGMAIAPVLTWIFVAKVAENSLDYSLSNTLRQALWLVTSREAKYKAKQVVDTFLVRAGDVLAAIAVLVGTRMGFGTRQFILLNLSLILLWIGILVLLTRQHSKETALVGSAAQ